MPVNKSAVKSQVQKAAAQALYDTASWILKEIDEDQTVPYLTGALAQSGTIDEVKDGTIALGWHTPYAARHYFVPMLHNASQHSAPTDHWADPYLNGGGRFDDVAEYFEKALKSRL